MKRLALTLIATIGLSVSPVLANEGLTNLTTQTDSYQTGTKVGQNIKQLQTYIKIMISKVSKKIDQTSKDIEKDASQAANKVVNKAKVVKAKLTKQTDQSEAALEKMANNTQDKAQSFKQGFDDGGDTTF
ncbi:MAG: rotein [Francisella endosymbiont of Hyalomma asiaticum]